MAASALTVTAPNPSPPTNFVTCGGSPPDIIPNFTKVAYSNLFNMSAINSPLTSLDGRPIQTTPGVGVNPNNPGYYDDGTALTTVSFAANKAALASGTSTTSGGTEGTYPGTGTYGSTSSTGTVNAVGAVPASKSAAHEGAGTEVLVTQTYSSAVLVPGSAATYQPTGQTPAWADGAAGGPLRTTSDLGNYVGGATSINGAHASSLSPATNPAISATPASTLSPTTVASGTNTFALTVTGTNFTPQSVVYINNIPQVTVFVSSTSLTVAAALKKTTAGTLPVTVVTGGVVVTANSCNMTYS